MFSDSVKELSKYMPKELARSFCNNISKGRGKKTWRNYVRCVRITFQHSRVDLGPIRTRADIGRLPEKPQVGNSIRWINGYPTAW